MCCRAAAAMIRIQGKHGGCSYERSATNRRNQLGGAPRQSRVGKHTLSRRVARHPPGLRDGGPASALHGRVRDPSWLGAYGRGADRQGLLVGDRLRGTCPRDGRLEGPRAIHGTSGVPLCPLAFHISRTLQQGVAKTLEVAAAGAPVGSYILILLALLKAIEYGCLGVIIGWVGRRPWGGALAHVAVGLAVGILFGGAIVSFTYWTAPEPLAAADLFSRSANEILFPVGCSLVLYSATALGERVGR